MNRNKSIVSASMVVALGILLGGCEKKAPEEDPKRKPQRQEQQAFDCEKLAIDECVSHKECRYLRYRKPATSGLCVDAKGPKQTECFGLDDQYCELEGYLPGNKQCQKREGGCRNLRPVTQKTVKELFALSADWQGKSEADLDAALSTFSDQVRLLTKDELTALADEKADPNNVYLINRLVALPMRTKTYDLLERYLSKLDPAVAKAHVNRKVSGVSPVMALTRASGRPANDDQGKREQAIKLVVKSGASLEGVHANDVGTLMSAINASSSEASMNEVFDNLDKSQAMTKAWLAYAVKTGTPGAKAAVKAKIDSAADPALRSELISSLFATAAKEDFTQAPGQPKTKVTALIDNAGEWFDKPALSNPSFNLAPEAGLGAGPLPLAIVRFLRAERGANIDQPADINYAIKVNEALKSSVGDAAYAALLGGSAAEVRGLIAGTAAKQNLYADVITQDNARAASTLWAAIKGDLLDSAANITKVTDTFQPIFDLPVDIQKDIVVKTVSFAPDAASHGLQLVNNIMIHPLTTETKDLFAKIFNLLPDYNAAEPAKMSKKKWLEQPTIAPDTFPGRFALADFFVARPFLAAPAPGADAPNTYDEMAKLISSIANDLDVMNANSVVPVLAKAILERAVLAGSRDEFQKLLERVTKLADGPDGAQALRGKISKGLVTQRYTPGGTDSGIIFWLFYQSYLPLDARVHAIFKRLWDDLTGTEKTAWIRQEASDYDDATAMWGLLARNLSAEDTHWQQVRDLVATESSPIPTRGDIEGVFESLAGKTFSNTTANAPLGRESAMLILSRIIGFSGTPQQDIVRKRFLIGLVGGQVPTETGGVEPFGVQTYPAGSTTYPQGASLVQTMLLGPIDQALVDVFTQMLKDQDPADPNARVTMINQNGGGLPGPMLILTDWNRATAIGAFIAGDRLGAPAPSTDVNVALHPGDNAAQMARLFRMLLLNGESLNGFNATPASFKRDFRLATLLFTNSPAGANQYMEFAPLFSRFNAANKRWLAYWSIFEDGRGPAINRIFASATVSAPEKAELRDWLFRVAIESSARDYPRVVGALGDPTVHNAATLVWTYANFPAFDRLLAAGNPFGLPANSNSAATYSFNIALGAAPPDVRQGNLIWYATTFIEYSVNPAKAGTAFPAGAINRLEAFVRTVARYIKGYHGDGANWGVYADTDASGGAPSAVKQIGFPAANSWLLIP